MPGRYAIYYAPEKGGALDEFGNRWLGRNAESGQGVDRFVVDCVKESELLRVTKTPAFYGFHGTLKPPFELADGQSEEDLLSFARAFAASRKPFEIFGLSVKAVSNFLALVPGSQKEIFMLAEDCLRSFDPFRAPPSFPEMERRRAKGLTPVQERLLVTWGYPYVLEAFCFHLSLTGGLRKSGMVKKLTRVLNELTVEVRRERHLVDGICLFYQPDRCKPFSLIHRIPFGG